MSTQVKHQLWRLVRSLSKAEKRNFKLYALRGGATNDSQFVRLFDLLDHSVELDEGAVRNQMDLTTAQYSNLKRHLYQQVLTSLRHLHIAKEIDMELREQIDFSRILYGKGHYLDALRLLERAKLKAAEHNQDLLHLEIIEFQKLIEARHVTLSRQIQDKMDRLLSESAIRSHTVQQTSHLLNLNIQIHGRYIERGHSRNSAEATATTTYWESLRSMPPGASVLPTTFHQRINRFQAAMWYHYIQLDFSEAQEAAQEAVTLFTLSPQMTLKDPDLYLRCLYYVTLFAYLNQLGNTVTKYRRRMAAFLDDDKVVLNENSRRVGEVYRKLSRYNELFLEGDLEGAYDLSQLIRRDHTLGRFRPADHRWGQFLYKAAAAAFLRGAYSEALDDLNEVINMKTGIHRDDLLINTRLLHALCSYELQHYSLVEYHLASLGRLLRRSRETAEVHRQTLATLRRLINAPVPERGPLYDALAVTLRELEDIPFEVKALTYLDVRQWLTLHIPDSEPAAAP